jgi:hypothetical protein
MLFYFYVIYNVKIMPHYILLIRCLAIFKDFIPAHEHLFYSAKIMLIIIHYHIFYDECFIIEINSNSKDLIFLFFQVHRQHDQRFYDGFRNCLLLGHASGHHQPPRREERGRSQDCKVSNSLIFLTLIFLTVIG